MKTIAFKIIVLVFLSVSNQVYSNTDPETTKTIPQQEFKINTEELQTYYEEGISYYKMAEYLNAEESFLKAIDLAEKSKEKEILSYSFHFLGNNGPLLLLVNWLLV